MKAFERKMPDVILIVVLASVYVAHAWLFRHWIVDDAGISFAYSRNLASGWGLVSQPGTPPVEGFSNFLWVLLMAPFFLSGIFHPYLTPKLIAAGLMVGIITFLFITIRRLIQDSLVSFLAVLMVIINSSVVIWSTSGLENPLYAFLLVVSFALVIFNPPRAELLLGITCGLLALTRPDGMLYTVLMPLIFLYRLLSEELDFRRFLSVILTYAAVSGGIVGSFLTFRYLYFHDFLPNTYYAKCESTPVKFDHSSLILLWQAEKTKLYGLLGSVFGRYSKPMTRLVFAASVYLLFFKAFRKWTVLAGMFLLGTLLVYMILPVDWMDEFRFATPFFVFIYVHMFMVLKYFTDSLPVSAAARKAVLLAVVTPFLFFSADTFLARSTSFALSPTVPLEDVANTYSRFDKMERAMGGERASLLLPDMGGSLFYSDLRLYDMAGLCDRTIARTIFKGDKAAFYNYVFVKVKPTFIHTHHNWTLMSRLDEDPRFRSDYSAISENYEPDLKLYSGNYVRKDALDAPSTLERLRKIR